MNDYDIFISYSRLDIGLAQKIKKELEEKTNLTFWMDLDGIESASQFEEVIINAIDNSKAVIFLLSEHSMKSEYAKKEVRYACGVQKKLIPVKIDGSSPRGWFLFNFSGIDVIDYNDALQSDKLIRDLKSWFPFSESKSPNVLDKEGECAEIHIETDMDCYVQRFHNTITVAKVGVENVIHLPKGRHKLQFVAVQNSNVRFDCEYKVSDLFESDYIEVSLLEKAGAITNVNREPIQQHKEIETAENHKYLNHVQEEVEEVNQISFKFSGIEFNMIYVEGGTFNMGKGSDSHQVTLSSYYIGETPVTQGFWAAVMGNNPSYYKGDDLPVEQVTWDDCHLFVERLNQILSRDLELIEKKFSLPTEAEWEYAARGGNKSCGYQYSGSNNIQDVAWCNDMWGNTHPVKSKASNELHIYDMSGNVDEWCEDWHGCYSKIPQINPKGPASGSRRICRGGSWISSVKECNVFSRRSPKPSYCRSFIGFRLSLSEIGSSM